MENLETNTELIENTHKKKNNKKIVTFVIILLLAITVGTGVFFVLYNTTKKTPEVEKNDTDVKETFTEYRIKGNNLDDFDLSLLKIEKKESNVIYSPLSIKYALSMLNEGTDGESKKQIDDLIGDYKANKYINSSNISLANALFINDSFRNSVKESYAERLKNVYDAEVLYDYFNTPDVINNWVINKTLGLINNLVDDVSDKQFVLINALAIDMEWKNKIQTTYSDDSPDMYTVDYPHQKYSAHIEPFDGVNGDALKFNKESMNANSVEIGATINNYDIINTLGEDNIRTFITDEYIKWSNEYPNACGRPNIETTTFVNKYISELGSSYKHVSSSTDFKFYDDENVKVFSKELKEYDGTTLEYIGVMPKNETLSEYIKTIKADELNDTINKTKTIELDNFEKGSIYSITGRIPLFKYSYDLNLKENLIKLGVKNIFELGKANLTKIVDDPNTFIDSAKHKANIEFSNDGIKAAAYTEIGGYGADECGFDYLYEIPLVRINLSFNNPYLYIIRDTKTGEVWFVGTVYEPELSTNTENIFED